MKGVFSGSRRERFLVVVTLFMVLMTLLWSVRQAILAENRRLADEIARVRAALEHASELSASTSPSAVAASEVFGGSFVRDLLPWYLENHHIQVLQLHGSPAVSGSGGAARVSGYGLTLRGKSHSLSDFFEFLQELPGILALDQVRLLGTDGGEFELSLRLYVAEDVYRRWQSPALVSGSKAHPVEESAGAGSVTLAEAEAVTTAVSLEGALLRGGRWCVILQDKCFEVGEALPGRHWSVEEISPNGVTLTALHGNVRERQLRILFNQE
ncbi:hypothetical protein Selin_0605 [Desulfurispirillum indicum S5]|uniref:Fimbrial assembly family protein n=1 Tax=Desulfurispirillum indicum (strain ATCC BAA-1389 / DSM 22839 / S5) TaxID=653733 RepID=E6W121_DESIS|nr:hypothetical protein Selin_0605 [Desulfurispirillum indicum S5]